MTIVYAPGSRSASTPMLRIANRYLLQAGFTFGSKVEVKYGIEIITIKLIKQQHEHANILQTSHTIPLSSEQA